MEIGSKLKQMRLQCGFTQEELAGRCDLTKGYISQLENDLTSPSIATLVDLMVALGSDLKTFFADAKDEQIVFTHSDFFVKEDVGQRVTWLVPNCQKNEMEPILMEVGAKTSLQKDMPHEGEEFGFVLEGKVEVIIGDKRYKCGKGDSFYYVADKTHYIENKTDKLAKIIWVSSPPTF